MFEKIKLLLSEKILLLSSKTKSFLILSIYLAIYGLFKFKRNLTAIGQLIT